MKYITFTHVDAITGVPVSDAPAPNGPAYPAGARFGFALESRYPTAVPIFYGTILAADDETAPGIFSVITKAEYDAAQAEEIAAREARYAVTPAMVDEERDRRIDAGFAFAGERFQSRPEDRENILGAASLAHMALTIGGKKPGDLRWHGGDRDFVWIAEDNSLVPMDAMAVIAFGNAAAMHKSDHTFAARTLKDVLPVEDIAADQHWPER